MLITRGLYVPDDITNQLVLEEIQGLCSNNQDWILDGYPRTMNQAQLLNQLLTKLGQPLQLVINLDVPHSVILSRLEDRLIHLPSGRTYNLNYNPPKVAGIDDVTGEPLVKRPDDEHLV